ncbi:MAG: hypothetical protein OXR64_15260 [Chloroflexota bacterium]|nr:hypothetical protein [Chloroflexota bacterium]MDE2921194.1 hypothetical protein [Chloroflexota bacterium]
MQRPVEQVFGTSKRSYGYQRVRSRGLVRHTTEMWFKLLACYLRRADRVLTGASMSPWAHCALTPGRGGVNPTPRAATGAVVPLASFPLVRS